jgi:hypothetical protein
MVKINDRVYHVYNMGMKGVVERIEVEGAQVYLAAGPAQGRLVAHVRTDDGKVVRMPVSDLMRDD